MAENHYILQPIHYILMMQLAIDELYDLALRY